MRLTLFSVLLCVILAGASFGQDQPTPFEDRSLLDLLAMEKTVVYHFDSDSRTFTITLLSDATKDRVHKHYVDKGTQAEQHSSLQQRSAESAGKSRSELLGGHADDEQPQQRASKTAEMQQTLGGACQIAASVTRYGKDYIAIRELQSRREVLIPLQRIALVTDGALVEKCLKEPVVIEGHGKTNDRKPFSVETDHGGDPSDQSTDEIFLKYDDGTKEYLTKNSSMERCPVISYDDSIVAFIRRVDSNEDGVVNRDDETELWVMRLGNRSESHIVKDLSDASGATWHPSQLRLAFIATNRQEKRSLYSYDLPSKSLERLSDSARHWPEWSPNGDYIAYYDAGNRVVLYDVTVKKTKVLTENVGNGWALYWTVDNRLVFIQEPTEWRIYVPGTEDPVILTEAELKELTMVKQDQFGWASITAEP